LASRNGGWSSAFFVSGSANLTKSAAVATWWLRSNTFSVGTGVGVGCGNRVGVRSTSTALKGVNVGISSGLLVGFKTALGSRVASGSKARVGSRFSVEAGDDAVTAVDFTDLEGSSSVWLDPQDMEKTARRLAKTAMNLSDLHWSIETLDIGTIGTSVAPSNIDSR